MARHTDTIAAIATPAGTAALAIVRVSGPASTAIAASAISSPTPPRHATHADYLELGGKAVDDVVATLFPGPLSYSGEDSLEISCHGSPFIAKKILSDLVARGCRPAQPGEFTQRAFLNGRMDLSQAEAVMDLIAARSERSLAAAREMLRGALGRHLSVIVERIVGALATVEAHIDFPDEDLPPEDHRLVKGWIEEALRATDQLLATERTGALLREGIRTVILGEPNAGKSSLMNRLVGSDRAIVTDEPGTTRDYIEERISLGPHGIRLIDTAGLNLEAAGIEKLGVGKSLELASTADLILLVLDSGKRAPLLPEAVMGRITPSNTLVVLNKTDLLAGGIPAASPLPGIAWVSVSALDGSGIQALESEIARLADGLQTTFGEERIAINVRHAHFLAAARACLGDALAKATPGAPPELLASDLRGALDAFGEISGKVDNERMLDQLFASFCIGK